MGRLIAAAASSHAFTIEDPAGWDQRRQRNRENYRSKYGEVPPEQPNLETDADLRARAGRITEALSLVRHKLAELKPDVLVVVGDDQDEAFPNGNYPQFAVYLGGDFKARGLNREGPGHPCRSDSELAHAIYRTCVENDIDAMALSTLPDQMLPSHAFGPMLDAFDPDSKIPVVAFFINAVHMPAPSPARCHHAGEVIAQAIKAHDSAKRVAILASGGLSHFPASYPPGYFGQGSTFPWGSIDEKFDRWVVDRIQAGDGKELTSLSAMDLIKHGDVELRSWIGVLGAVGDAKPQSLVYEPIYRGITGMGVGFWELA